MALSANTVWEIRTSGHDSNGGGFVAGASGTDRSQQDAPHVTIDGATITASVHTTTTQLTLTGYSVIAADVGNLLRITGGTATAGVYEITAIDAGNNRWTLDRAAGSAAQTVQGRMGGALASVGRAAGAVVAGNQVWVKAGTYMYTTDATNVSGGFVALSTTAALIEGYGTTRGDRAGRPVLSLENLSTGSVSVFVGSAARFAHLHVEGHNKTRRAFDTCLLVDDCVSVFAGTGATTAFYACTTLSRCYAERAFSGYTFCTLSLHCEAKNCHYAYWDRCSYQIGCVAWKEAAYTAASSYGYLLMNNALCDRCTAHGLANDGYFSSSGTNTLIDCASTGNGRAGIYVNSGTALVVRCATHGNTSGRSAGPGTCWDRVPISLSADPWMNAAAGDLRPNQTPGGGTLLRDAGLGLYGQTDPIDVGAVQHRGGTVLVAVRPTVR